VVKTQQVFPKTSQVVAILIQVPLCNLGKKYKNHPSFLLQFSMSWGPPNRASNSPIQPLLASTMIATTYKTFQAFALRNKCI